MQETALMQRDATIIADTTAPTGVRSDWTREEIAALFDLPFTELVFRAAEVHRAHHRAGEIQLCTLLSIKTGGCPEDCGYCSQSVKADSGVEATKLMEVQAVLQAAAQARDSGSKRFCMGAAWRNPKERDMPAVIAMVKGVREMGLETCMTLGMLTPGQAAQLAEAGLDYYNHNIDTSPEFYGQIITTPSLQDRLDTLEKVRNAGINVCCGGIVGLGETKKSRAALLAELANMNPPPDSVPINNLVQVEGTPLGKTEAIDPFDFVRMIAAARITMPASYVRLSAGRQEFGDGIQALCFLAGANSIFYGERLLTTDNPDSDADDKLFARLGLKSI